jgi:sensor domain CHASE-containing protein
MTMSMSFRSMTRCSSVDRFIVADGLSIVLAVIVMMVMVMTSQKGRYEII